MTVYGILCDTAKANIDNNNNINNNNNNNNINWNLIQISCIQ